MSPKSWPRLVRLVRLFLRLAQYWKTKKDLDLDLPGTDIDLEFGTGRSYYYYRNRTSEKKTEIKVSNSRMVLIASFVLNQMH